MPTQLTLGLPVPMPPHPVVVLRWSRRRVTSHWPEFNLRARFRTWPDAFAHVLHPNNAHVTVLIRTGRR